MQSDARARRTLCTSDTPHYEQVPFEIPGSWEWTTVNIISKSILYGVSESAKASGKYKLLRITDIQNNSVQWDSVPYTDFDENKANSYLLNDGDILFARTGATVGKSYLVQGLTEEAIYASYLIRVQTYDAVLPQYIKFYFESGYYWEQIEQGSVGVGQPNVNGTILGNLHIPIPPIHEQCRIVSELSKWMVFIDVIEQGKADLQTVIKQTKSKILDLAIHGKLVPQDHSDEPASELLKRINPASEITCDNGQYEKIPKNWCWCKLEELCKIKGGKRIPRGMSFSNDKTPYVYLRVTDMKSNTIQLDDLKYIDKEVFEQIKNYTINSTDLYLTIAGTIGSVGIIPEVVDGMNLTENAAKLTNITCNKEYLLYALQSSIAQDHFTSRFHQVAQPKLSIETANKTPVPLPPLAEQQRIVTKIEELFISLDNIQKALEV